MEKIKTLRIDLETFSDIDLAKCGVYRYVESPAFEILLFGVSVNGGDVVVYDLAQGEKIPTEILTALTDISVIKWAFNATFERVCLSAASICVKSAAKERNAASGSAETTATQLCDSRIFVTFARDRSAGSAGTTA